MKIKFTVVTCNPNEKGGFVFKLEVVELAKVFGMTKSVKRTYYIGGMPEAVEVGTEFEEEMDNFEVKEYDYTFRNEETGNDETIQLKWLHVKTIVDKAISKRA